MKNDPIVIKFDTLNQMGTPIGTMIEIIGLKVEFLNSEWRADAILKNIVVGHNAAAISVKFCLQTQNTDVKTV